MQTFLPSPNYSESASVLDDKRLGKQRVETLQIMKSLIQGGGWKFHPATLMWQGYEKSLLDYQYAICFEWHVMRGYADTCLKKTIDLFYTAPYLREDWSIPYWMGDEEFHLGHQSNLISKDPEWYQPMFPGVPDNLPYKWPTEF